MSRCLTAVFACYLSLSVCAADPPTSDAETYLHQGKLAEGETALLLALDANPNDEVARFGLGVTQFFRALENLGQALYEYGANSENNQVPFLRLPVPKNPYPSTISYRELGRVLDCFATDLSRAEATLAAIKSDDVKLSLRLSSIQLNFAGSAAQPTKLIEVIEKLNQGRKFDFQKLNPEFTIHFDRADVAWLRAYCHLLSAMVDSYRSVDSEAWFEIGVNGIFPKVETSPKAADAIRDESITITDGPRLRRVRLHLLAVCELNVETWKHIRSESDDDFEWLSNPKQTDQLGLPITNQQIDGWLSMINELEQLLSGKSLIPGELFNDLKQKYTGHGLNIKTLMDNPRPDLLYQNRIQEQVIDPQYLENMNGKKPINIAMLFQAAQLFDGPFGFARAIRMN